jgi:hypothetical protein
MQAVPVPSAQVAKAWPFVQRWVAEALAGGHANHAVEEVRASCERAAAQLWLAWERRPRGVCITEIHDSVRGKTCNLVAVAGEDFGKLAPLLETIKAWARENGCVRLEATGRGGWERLVRAQGWQRIRTTIEMRL